MRNALFCVFLCLIVGSFGCRDEISSDDCRLDPESCRGGAGGLCSDDRDCASELECCRDNDNCGDGMCTATCDVNDDCPVDMRCKHNLCFYACDDDDECAPGMSCEHDNTVCEWE